MSKYGLQLRVRPQQKQQPTRPPLPAPLGFNDDDEDNVERDILRQNYKNKTHKDIEEQHKKALEEDPSAFDYDGVYDEMKEKQVRPKEQDRQDRKLTPLVLHQIYLLLLLHFTTHIFSVAGSYSRANFPVDFVFGSGTAAPQYEGAAFEDGRTPSIWDTFAGGAEGNVGCDGYHKYKGDVKLMVDLGLEAFRISISWSRLIPDGRGPVNAKGLHYYNNLINELINNGIQPHVTLSHFDLPQALHDKYGGWLNRTIVKDFVEYANVCFKEFGDRVLHWTTLNEVNIAAFAGYDQGIIPPGRCSVRATCTAGDSTTEPYTGIQNGKIGINIYALGMVPYTNSDEDVMATQRANDFYIGWVLDPLVFGDYPDIVKKRAQTRIPAFTRHESEQVKGSLDFIGLNHYTTISVKDDPTEHDINDFLADMAVETIFENEGGTITDFQYYPPMPWGFIGVLEYIKDVYGNPPIYIQENGQITPRDGALNDTVRVDYLQAYIGALLDAVRNGSSIKGYFEWTLLDCEELLNAYATSFGLYYVDLDETELTRYQKLSARWYSSFLKGNVITQGGEYTTSLSLR